MDDTIKFQVVSFLWSRYDTILYVAGKFELLKYMISSNDQWIRKYNKFKNVKILWSIRVMIKGVWDFKIQQIFIKVCLNNIYCYTPSKTLIKGCEINV